MSLILRAVVYAAALLFRLAWMEARPGHGCGAQAAFCIMRGEKEAEMILDDRLEAVASFVPPGCRVADIGTDHGYLAMELYQRDKQRTVIAADKNAGPCQAAQRTLAEAGLADIIQVRQGDGLKALAAGEADTVCIAGMGGKLISDILSAEPHVLSKLRYLVLQPQNAYSLLRRWLYEHDWHIVDEALAKVDGRVYQIVKAQAGRAAMPPELALKLGPVLLARRPALFAQHVENNLASCRKILHGLRQSEAPDAARIMQLEAEIGELEGLLP